MLEKYVGHVEHSPGGRILFPPNNPALVKTHEYPINTKPAIYVVRDGREATVSLWNFYNRSASLREIIDGRHHLGTWGNHLAVWKPWERKDTLLLEYEELRDNLPLALDKLSGFLQREIISRKVPDRGEIAGVDGRWVGNKNDWKKAFTDDLLQHFNELNGAMLKKIGYEL